MGHLLCGRHYNPITVLEQMTYIFFMKMLDDKQLQEEENARDWDSEVENPTFPEGQLWINPDATTDEEKAGIPYESLRWHVFKNLGADNMFKVVRQHVFEFIKHIGTGEEKRLQPLHEVGYLPHSQRPNPYQGDRWRGFSRHEQPRCDGRCI